MDTRIQVPQSLSVDSHQDQLAKSATSVQASAPIRHSDLRAVLANRFMRMLRLHDRARDQLLASHQTQLR